MQPRSGYIDCSGHEIHYLDWGATDAPPVVMWHGLARNGRDFDDIATDLACGHHVICPDTIGRGLSAWSGDPDSDYCLASYARIAAALIDGLGLGGVQWVGTSMGGALGILAAATTLRGRIARLVINDIGPTLPPAPAARIRAYVGNPPAFATMTEMEAYLRFVYEPFGPHTDAQWRRMAETTMRRLPSGQVTTHYDPAIVRQLIAHPRDYELWDQYDSLDLPVLVLRGTASDVLLADTAQAMTERGPRARLEEIAGCGHAPALNVAGQIALVREFLDDAA